MSNADEDEARRARSAERRDRMRMLWTARDSNEDVCPISGDEAVSLVRQLTLSAWSLAGLTIPVYARHEIPVRFVPRRRTNGARAQGPVHRPGGLDQEQA